ncbi:MAG: glycosyltransferase [Solirubrobacteraceae bacterium]
MASAHRASPASIVIPTRGRADYLQVALSSIAPQARAAGAELIVVDDAGESEEARKLASRFGARYEPHPRPLGLNVARNTGVERSSGELIVFVDDDVRVCEGWLAALLQGARAHPEVEVFTGPIVPRLEGHPPRSCGREGAPITSLQLGGSDRKTRYAWGSNMAIRRRALQRIGPFDVALEQGGDEQEWQDRLHASAPANRSAEALYVADAALHHRRSPSDARLPNLCRASFARGRGSRRFDVWRGQAPSLARELATLGGCVGHVLLRRCPMGLTMVAHSAGRLREATHFFGSHARVRAHARVPALFRYAPPTPPEEGTEDFLSGESGTVGGIDGARRRAADALVGAAQIAGGQRLRLARAARSSPPTRRVLVLAVQRPEHARLAEAIEKELKRSRHEIELRSTAPGERGKFENLNVLLDGENPLAAGHDWLLVVDDDIALPRGFLDRFVFLAERFSLDLAQPAHAYSSHAAWQVTRRRRGSVARETRFVEIGPLTAFGRRTFSTLLPFPELRMGWGLDVHWGALAREHGWRCGVIDALPIRHRAAPAASAYSREQAIAEARAFLRERPYLSAEEAQRTLAVRRSW